MEGDIMTVSEECAIAKAETLAWRAPVKPKIMAPTELVDGQIQWNDDNVASLVATEVRNEREEWFKAIEANIQGFPAIVDGNASPNTVIKGVVRFLCA